MMKLFAAFLLLFVVYPSYSDAARRCVVMDCASNGYSNNKCNIPGITSNPTNIQVSVKTKKSRSACTSGTSFGVDGKQIYVRRGCRATFDVCFDDGAPAAAAAVTGSQGAAFTHLGCFNDRGSRAISGRQTNYAADKAIVECFNRAKAENNEVFAVQYNTQCFTSGNAGNTYTKYGPAAENKCRNGRGGTWTMDVYKITGGSSAGTAGAALGAATSGGNSVVTLNVASVRENNVIHTFPTLPKIYTVSCSFKLNQVTQGWTSILRLSTGVSDHQRLGDRIPALFLLGKGLHVATSLNDNPNDYINHNIELNKWVDIRVMYFKTGSTYRFKVDIDGREVKNVENNNPQVYQNVKVYASDRYYPAFKGEIRNLKVTFGGTSGSSAGTAGATLGAAGGTSGNTGNGVVQATGDNLCPREQGFCVKANGHDQNSGVIRVNGNDGNSDNAQVVCMNACLARAGATGCEMIWNQGNRGCYIHTQEVARGNNAGNHYCYVFSKCKGGQGVTTGAGAPTVQPYVRPPPPLAETIFGTPSTIVEDYVKFKITVNDQMGFPIHRRTFGAAHTCPDGKGVNGFRLRFKDVDNLFEAKLSGIEMTCVDGTILGPDTVRYEGDWKPWLKCDTNTIATGFNYRAVQNRGGRQLKMKCSNGKELGPSGVDIGTWGVGQDFSGCPASATFCGFASELGHDYIGRMRFLCCSPAPPQAPLVGDSVWTPFGRDVCLGARDEQFGAFHSPVSGFLTGLKFTYIEGSLTCSLNNKKHTSKFGCTIDQVEKAFAIFVTDSKKGIILPDHNQITYSQSFYNVPGHDAAKVNEFVLQAANPMYVHANAELRAYYGEDLYDQHEHDNAGRLCVHVHGSMLAA